MFYANDIRQKALPLIFGWLLKKSQKIEKFCLKFEKLFLISAIESEVFFMLKLIKKVHRLSGLMPTFLKQS